MGAGFLVDPDTNEPWQDRVTGGITDTRSVAPRVSVSPPAQRGDAYNQAINAVTPGTFIDAADQIVRPISQYAPGGSIASLKTAATFSVVPDIKINMPSPSVDVFFDSMNKFHGTASLAVLMSGMGRDGAMGLLNLHNSGAETVVQDSESSVVYGMPGEALKLKAAKYVMTPEEIVAFIKKLAESKR